MVCEAGIRQISCGRSQTKARSQKEIWRRRSFAYRYRACGHPVEDHHLHLASRHHHRPQRVPRSKSFARTFLEQTGKEVLISIQEIRHPELNAQLQAEKIAQQLEKRIVFRRAMKKTMEESQRFGAQGIKVMIAGRLNGAEIARTEWSLQGRLPLHTLASRYRFRICRGVDDIRDHRRQSLDLSR